MLGTPTIQQYFAGGNTHYVNPQVSFEWNYNLFYAPYATVNDSYSPTLITESWSPAPSTVPSGRTTSVFLNDTSLTTRSCYSFNTTTGQGDSSVTLSSSIPAGTTDTYKITFWAKVDGDAQVNLSALAYIDYHRAHSVSQTIDSILWTKFEIYLSPSPLGTPYTSPVLSLHHGSADGTATYGVLIDQLEIRKTSDFEYRYGNLWDTSAPFNSHRPGESYVPSGNSLCQLGMTSSSSTSTFRKIKTDLGIESGSTTYGSNSWNNQVMPVSPVLYHPTLLGTNSFNPIYKNGFLSEWSKYKYFVSAPGSSQKISASYDEILNVNKIVIKFNTAYSIPSAFTVTLNGATNTFAGGYTNTYSPSVINLTSSDIDSSGTCILYYQSNGTWLSALNSGPWVGTTDTSTVPGTPSFAIDGNIKFGGAKGGTVNATVAINSIQVTQTSSTINASYTGLVDENFGSLSGVIDKSSEFKRMQVIEVSPRLEVDVSYYTMSVSTQAELDNKMNPLPISQISSNMATITLSNIPLLVSTGVLSLFSNNSTTSVLKGLFKNYVKCYINYRILDTVAGASGPDLVIPGGVFYVDTWDNNDIEKTTVTAYDISKYLQLVQPTDYVAQTEDAFRLITNILDFAGFTDYDYDSLKRVTSSVHVSTDGTKKTTLAPIRIRYFYVDGTQQKVFDVLREIFEAYQIAAYIDSYGVMKFINVDGIFDPSNPITMQLHDTTGGVSVNAISGSTINDGYVNSLNIAPNIIIDTFTEVTKTKVGKATFTYKTPQIEKTVASDTRLLNNNLYVNYAPTFMDSTNAIWDSTIDEAVTYNTLHTSMKQSDTFFTVPQGEATAASTSEPIFRTYGIDHDGYAIIENEIVSFQYKEFAFIPTNPAVKPVQVSVLNSADYAAKFAEVSTQFGNNPFNVMETGRITNVKRGQFGTQVADHLVMKSASDVASKFNITNAPIAPTIRNGNILLQANQYSTASIISLDPIGSSNPYMTFSTKIKVGLAAPSDYPDGTSYGLILNSSTNIPIYVYITKYNGSLGGIKYLLFVRRDSFKGTNLLTTDSIDVTHIMNTEAKSYPSQSPFEDYGKYINLKFVKNTSSTGNKFQVYLNKTQVPLSTTSAPIDTSGAYGIFINAGYSAYSGVSAIEFSELYATKSALLSKSALYHYQLPWFSEKLASNKKIFDINYMVQSSPSIVGINYYDVQDTQAPSLDAYPLKLSYDWYYYINGNAPTALGNAPSQTQTQIINGQIVQVPILDAMPNISYIPVDKDSLSYSPIYHSGFRSRFAIVNCSPSQVWIRKSPDTVNKINVDFSLITRSLITLGTDVVLEKVFDIANINETVDITSSWVQDKNTASAILRTIYRALEGFSKDTTISVYGNPLFEIGDIVVINYKLKNILNQKYIIQGITQTFETGLTTTLILNQIANNSTVVLPNTYIAPLQTPAISTGNSQLPITSTPTTIFSVSATPGVTAGTFSASWSNPPSGTVSYNVMVGGVNIGSLSPNYSLSSVSATTENYTGAVPGELYSIYVTALDSGGNSIGSVQTSANAAGGTSVFVATASTGASPGGFTISWSNAPSSTTQYGISITPATSTITPNPYTFTSSLTQSFLNGTPGGYYTATVTPYDSTMIPTATSSVVSVTAGAAKVLPGTPTISYSAITSSGFTATWSATNADSYSVNVYNSSRGYSIGAYPLITSNTSATITGLPASTQYSVSVQAINLSGNSPTFTNYTTTSSYVAPSVFTVVGTKPSYASLHLSWSNPPPGTVSYSIQLVGPYGDSSYHNTSATSWDYSYLIPNATYTMTVIALNGSSVTISDPHNPATVMIVL